MSIRLLLKLNHTSHCCDGGSNIIFFCCFFSTISAEGAGYQGTQVNHRGVFLDNRGMGLVWAVWGRACAGPAWQSQPLTKPHGCFRHCGLKKINCWRTSNTCSKSWSREYCDQSPGKAVHQRSKKKTDTYFFPASFRNGLSFPLLCKFNSNIPEGMNSLHCELQLAQSSEVWIKL